jgi:hypothetical protein
LEPLISILALTSIQRRIVNRIGSSISRELKATQEDGRFYIQRSSCSIEITYESDNEVQVAIEWHTGARLLGHGSKSWRTRNLKEAARRLYEFAPNVNVPYQSCVAELVTHLPLNNRSGKVVTFSPFVTPEALEDEEDDRTPREQRSSD